MEIGFEKKLEPRYRESIRLAKRIQESAESVVPDTEEDIGRIAAVQSSVLLKSKDMSGRGVLITGEARACVLCIGEGGERISCVRLAKPFSAEFEVAELTGEEQTQISLAVAATDARLLNPRKLSVTFDLAAELSCYVPESIAVETTPPGESCRGLHVRCAETELTLPNAVCEKSFVLNEQFPLPAGTAKPERLLCEQAEIRADDCQLIGSKAVVKGRALVRIAWLGEDGSGPVQASFSSPFSQIIDIGAETMDLCTVQPQVTGAYYDLIDSISGEKMLDTEIHILLQLVCRSRVRICTVADAYSNLTPLTAQTETQSFQNTDQRRTLRINAAETIDVTEDCTDVKCVFPTISRCALEGRKLSASVNFDILYGTGSGELSAVRRTLMLEEDCGEEEVRLLSVCLAEIDLRLAGKSMEARLALEAQTLHEKESEISSITAVTLDEERAFDLSRFPTLTMVRQEGESLWEIAKRFHSSVEAIEAYAGEKTANGEMLLVPKSV